MHNILTEQMIHNAWQQESIPDARLLLTMKGNLAAGTFELFAGKHFAEVDRNNPLFETTDCFFCNMLEGAANYYLATFLLCVIDWRTAKTGQPHNKHIDFSYPVEMLAYFIANTELFERNAKSLKPHQLVVVSNSVELMALYVSELNMLNSSIIADLRRTVAKFLL